MVRTANGPRLAEVELTALIKSIADTQTIIIV
jgi:hypothetical protein